MVGVEPECALWFQGTDAPAALVEVSVYGGAEPDAYDALTARVCELLDAVLGHRPRAGIRQIRRNAQLGLERRKLLSAGPAMKNTTLCYIEQGSRCLMLHRTKKANDENEGKWIGVGGKCAGGRKPRRLPAARGAGGNGPDADGLAVPGACDVRVGRVAHGVYASFHLGRVRGHVGRAVCRRRAGMGGKERGAGPVALGGRPHFPAPAGAGSAVFLS